MIEAAEVMEIVRLMLISDIFVAFLAIVTIIIGWSAITRKFGEGSGFTEGMLVVMVLAVILCIAVAVSDAVLIAKIEEATEVAKGGIL